jgi:LacI family transcriptional regulator, galactose operon repressor
VKKVTSFDVARRAGVSQPTVSRTLRNLPGASAETRARVLAAAAELSYIPSESGRALSTSSTRRIAVVSEELTNPFYPQLVGPIGRCLEEHDLRAVVVTHAGQGQVGLDLLADGSYDGVLLTTTVRQSTLPRDLTERGIPHVLVNRILDQPESPSCAVDNSGGVRLVADLVAGLGHREIASLQGPVNTSTGHERGEALRAALGAHGIRLPRHRVRRVAFDHDASLAAALELLDGPSPPTAIICGNDVIALGALSAAALLGLSVPGQLTVTGFDDIQLAGWPLIALTTVRCDLAALARTAVDLLLAEIAGHDGKSPANPFPPAASGRPDLRGAGTDEESPANPFPPDVSGRPDARGPGTEEKSSVTRIPVSLLLRGTHARPRQ